MRFVAVLHPSHHWTTPQVVLVLLCVFWLSVGSARTGSAQDVKGDAEPGVREAEVAVTESEERIEPLIQPSVNRGIEFLLARGQGDDGSFSPQTGAAVTALCVRAILENRPHAIDAPSVQKALQYIEGKVQSDGRHLRNRFSLP